MSTEPSQTETVPPELPDALLEPRYVIFAGAVLWAIAAVAAFTVPALEAWRPIAVSGLGVGVLGTSIFLWQLAAVRRGSRGAQSGLRRRKEQP
jgi:hypothetical protein